MYTSPTNKFLNISLNIWVLILTLSESFIYWVLILISAEGPYYQHQLQVWLTFCVTAQLAESSVFCSHAPSPRQGPRLTLKNFHQQVGCVRMPHHPTQAGIHWELRCLTKVMEFLHEIIFHSSLSWFSLSLLVTLDSRISFPVIVTQANPVLALIMPGQLDA